MLQAKREGNRMIGSIRYANIGRALVLFMMAATAAGALAQGAPAPDYAAVVAAPDRADADRQADARRKPVQLLAFTGVKPGMMVLDMETSAGYTAELLARVVGPSGKVFAQDSAAVIERFVKDKFDVRATEIPSPGLAEWSAMIRKPPGFSAANSFLFMTARSTGM